METNYYIVTKVFKCQKKCFLIKSLNIFYIFNCSFGVRILFGFIMSNSCSRAFNVSKKSGIGKGRIPGLQLVFSYKKKKNLLIKYSIFFLHLFVLLELGFCLDSSCLYHMIEYSTFQKCRA